MTKRATVYFDSRIHQALKIKAALSGCSVTELINNAIKIYLAEDAEDLMAFEERAGEPVVSFEEVLKKLKRDGRI